MGTVPDVSYWQGVISFGTAQAWYAAGIREVYVKIGGGDDGIYHDSKHDMSVTNLRAAGIACHRYFYNGDDPNAAADRLAAWLGGNGSVPLGAGERIAWDIESPAWSVGQEVAAINRLAGHGYGPKGTDHYGSSSTLGNKGPIVALGLDLWVAQYGSNNGQAQGSPSTGAWSVARLWQYTSNGQLPGYGGRLDLSTDTISGGGGGSDPGWGWINITVYPIRLIQQKINDAGYTPALDPDNIPGPATEAGIKWYQAKNGLDADGVVGPATAGKMFGAANPTPSIGGNITKRATSDVQAAINAQGYTPALVVDDKFGPDTTAGVEWFQRKVGITVDGIYGPDTDGHLFNGGNPTALTVDGIRGPMTTQREQLALHVDVDGIRGLQTIEAEQRYTGAGVDGLDGPDTARHLQQKLTDLGYGGIVGGVDEIVGPNTIKALQTALNDGRFGA